MSEPEGREHRARRPWYAEGLRFSCRPDCGRCCTRHGDYDYVYLDRTDVKRLAAKLALPVPEFRSRWTKTEDGHTLLRMDGPACPFLEGVRCGVYEARPAQCRSFPFWPENLESPAAWRETGTFCPGIGEGDLISVETIRKSLRDPAPP